MGNELTRRAALWVMAGWGRVVYLRAWLWSRPSYRQAKRDNERINRFLRDLAESRLSAEVR